jgi:uncharacterized membrane protein
MSAYAAAPGMILCFIAAVLLIFVSVSSPTWEKISFLDVSSHGSQIHFGVFGYTGSKPAVGYSFDAAFSNSVSIDTRNIHNLTIALILHPIAAGLSGLAFIFGMCGLLTRFGSVMQTLLSSLAGLVTLVVWVLDMALFGIVHRRLRNNGIPARLGNANWLTLGAFVALLLGCCAGIGGSLSGRYRRRARY